MKKESKEVKKDKLAEQLRLNTRATIDPFLEGKKRENSVSALLAGAGLRKRAPVVETQKSEELPVQESPLEVKKAPVGLLIDYGSDDED